MTRTLTPSRCREARSLRIKRRSRPNKSPISVAGRDQFSELKEKIVRYRIPSSFAARTTRRNASTPRRWPSARGSPRAAAQRPLPSMIIATCNGASAGADRSVAGTATFDIGHIPERQQCEPVSCKKRPKSVSYAQLARKPAPLSRDASNGQDFLFLGRQQLVDLRDHRVCGLLNVKFQPLMIILGNFVVLLEFLGRIETVAADVADRDLGGLGVFVRDLDEFLAPFFVELGNPQAEYLALGGRAKTKIGIDDRLLHRLDHGFVPDLHRKHPRLRHADRRKLV